MLLENRLRTVGASSLRLAELGLGAGSLGGLHASMSDDAARATIEAAWSAGVRYFDTAPWYGNTASEHRLGAFLRNQVRNDFCLTTKVGRTYRRPEIGMDFESSIWRKRWPGGLSFVPRPDYSYDGIYRSFEDSLARIGVPRIDALTIHDLDIRHLGSNEQVEAAFVQLDSGGGFRALRELRESGEIRAIGAGINFSGMIPRFIQRFEIDYFLVAMPYTLADQIALEQEFPLCEQNNTGIIIGAPFASGILATGAIAGARYNYQEAEAKVLRKVAAIEVICRKYDVSLSGAALQFPLFHPIVASVVCGADSPQQIRSNVRAFQEIIPAEFWADLKEEDLIAQDAPLQPAVC